MIEREFDIATSDGAMNTYSVRPDDGGPLPVVLMLMDAPGVREGLREICRRIAQSGYTVLLPNLYYRTAREFVLGATRDHPDAEANLKKMFGMVASIPNAKVAADVGAVLDLLPSLGDAKPGKIGLVGYCMSGAFVTAAAARHPDRIACFASYYGTRLITDKPELAAPDAGRDQGRGLLLLRRARHLRAARPSRQLREIAGCRALSLACRDGVGHASRLRFLRSRQPQ